MPDLNMMTYGTTPQERDIILARNRINVQDELKKVSLEKERNLAYRKDMIGFILSKSNNWTEAQLKSKGTKALERIYDNI